MWEEVGFWSGRREVTLISRLLICRIQPSTLHPCELPGSFGMETPPFASVAPPFVIPGQRLGKAVVN